MEILGRGAVSYERGSPAGLGMGLGMTATVPSPPELAPVFATRNLSQRERTFIEDMTSERKVKASREGSK